MDVTGSMQRWIDAARGTVMESVGRLRERMPSSRFRLAFVGYRDIHDANRFEVRDFSEDVAALTAFIHSVTASGGNDTPEDVAGGLFHSLSLSWDADVKLLLFCADAPAHGRKYTPAGCDDEFPKGDPDGRDPCDLVAQLAQRGVDMTCFRCTDMVDPMCALFMAAHEEGAKRPGGAGADANFVLLNVKAANAAPAAAAAGAPRWGGGPPAVAACAPPPPGAAAAFGVARLFAAPRRAAAGGDERAPRMPASGGSGISAAPCAPSCAPEEAPSAPSASDAFSEGLMASVERCMASAARRR
jgi:hypothetical protein